MTDQTSAPNIHKAVNEEPVLAGKSQRSPQYRAPRVVTLGKAVDLVQAESVGQNLDGPSVTRQYYK